MLEHTSATTMEQDNALRLKKLVQQVLSLDQPDSEGTRSLGKLLKAPRVKRVGEETGISGPGYPSAFCPWQ